MIMISSLAYVFTNFVGSVLIFIFGLLPTFTLETLGNIGFSDLDVTSIFGTLNYVLPVSNMVTIAVAFFGAVSLFNVFCISFNFFQSRG